MYRRNKNIYNTEFHDLLSQVQQLCQRIKETDENEKNDALEKLQQLDFSRVFWRLNKITQQRHSQVNKHFLLQQGILTGNEGVVKFLIDNIPKLDLNFGNVNLPLHLSCYYGFFSIVLLLLKKGVNVKKKSSLNINGETVEKNFHAFGSRNIFTVEECALLNDHEKVFELIISHTHRDDRDLAHLACCFNSAKCLQFIINKFPECISKRCHTFQNESALTVALQCSDPQVIEILDIAKADLGEAPGKVLAKLYKSKSINVIQQWPYATEYLINRDRASIKSHVGVNDNTLLHNIFQELEFWLTAMHYSDTEKVISVLKITNVCVKLLCEAKIDVHRKNRFNQLPLDLILHMIRLYTNAFQLNIDRYESRQELRHIALFVMKVFNEMCTHLITHRDPQGLLCCHMALSLSPIKTLLFAYNITPWSDLRIEILKLLKLFISSKVVELTKDHEQTALLEIFRKSMVDYHEYCDIITPHLCDIITTVTKSDVTWDQIFLASGHQSSTGNSLLKIGASSIGAILYYLNISQNDAFHNVLELIISGTGNIINSIFDISNNNMLLQRELLIHVVKFSQSIHQNYDAIFDMYCSRFACIVTYLKEPHCSHLVRYLLYHTECHEIDDAIPTPCDRHRELHDWLNKCLLEPKELKVQVKLAILSQLNWNMVKAKELPLPVPLVSYIIGASLE